MKKIIIILIISLFFNITIPIKINAENNYNPLNGGWLEEINGIKILHISGTNYEMGYQHGYLLKDEIEQNYRTIFNSDTGEIYSYILKLWNNSIKNYIPQHYLEEIQGIANGSGKLFEDIVVFSIGFATFLFGQDCMEMSAWGPATSDGKLIHMRSYDIPLNYNDPISGTYLQENQLLIVRKPNYGLASLYPSFAGDVFCKGGINEKEIAISCESSTSPDISLNATWFSCRILMVLDNATTAEEAINIMTSSKQGSSNYIISDGKIPIGFVYEETANFSYVGSWDDSNESIPPFWEINHVVRRKNFYIHPTSASLQRSHYDPRIYFILGLLPKNINWFTPWRFYKTLSLEIEERWNTLDLNISINMLRSIYRGNTDNILNFYDKLGLDPFYACHQWISYPKTGDFIISFADNENQAQYNQLNYFNLYELLESEPP